MTDVGVKARFQTGTTGNSSNQILKISDSNIARGVFYVFVNLSNWGVLEVSSDQGRALEVSSDQRSSVEQDYKKFREFLCIYSYSGCRMTVPVQIFTTLSLMIIEL